jgi:hypothetical protein
MLESFFSGITLQVTNMIDTQQQYIKLNIRGESKADKDE